MDPEKGRILVIDDEKDHGEAVAEALERVGFACRFTASGEEGLSLLRRDRFDIVLTDLRMSPVDGLKILEAAKAEQADAEVILLTGHGTIETAVEAIRRGAFNYLTKPVNLEQIRTSVKNAWDKVALLRANAELQRELDRRYGFEGIVGENPQMLKVLETVRQIAATTATILIEGESGTGKELIARAVHRLSPRKGKRFVEVNCAAIPSELIESELFGHEKGSFTGASAQRIGKFEQAHGGTLLLDEVGDMSLLAQAKVLRAIETGRIERVGGSEVIPVDVRLVTATNKDLAQEAKEKRFREDLYFRLNVVRIRLPPLRERREDLPLLLDFFLRAAAAAHGKGVTGISPRARALLHRYAWPGNVRELKNAVESMVVTARGPLLDLEDVPAHVSEALGEAPPPALGPALAAGTRLEDAERELIRSTLAMTSGNREQTAKILGIGERTLYRKLDRYGLK